MDKMSRIFMATVPRKRMKYQLIKKILNQQNTIKWIIAKETGHNTGYKHWQIRYKTEEEKSGQSQVKIWNRFGGHVEPAEDTWKYETKEKEYWCSWEEELSFIRYAKLTPEQALWEELLKQQNDRQVLVIYDPKGKHGKSFFTKYMYLNHKTGLIPAFVKGAEPMLQYAYHYKNDYYILDISRSNDAFEDPALWTVVEYLKDGWTADKRYESKLSLQLSPGVCVMTNKQIPNELLSDDRWIIRSIVQSPNP